MVRLGIDQHRDARLAVHLEDALLPTVSDVEPERLAIERSGGLEVLDREARQCIEASRKMALGSVIVLAFCIGCLAR